MRFERGTLANPSRRTLERLMLLGSTIIVFGIVTIAVPSSADVVTFDNEESLRAMPNSARDTFAFNRVDPITRRLTNYNEAGMLLLDGVHPRDPALNATVHNHYHLSFETITGYNIMMGFDRTTDPATEPRYLSSMSRTHTIQMTFDPNNDGVPDPFNLKSIDIVQGRINVGVKGPFGIARYLNLTAPSEQPFGCIKFGFGCTKATWNLIDANNLTRATLEGIDRFYAIDNIVFEPAISIRPANSSQKREALAIQSDTFPNGLANVESPEGEADLVEVTEFPLAGFTDEVSDFVHRSLARTVAVDIIPAECGNEIEIDGSRGIVLVAVLGAADFDVREINPNTLFLEGVAPLGPRRLDFRDIPTTLVPFTPERCAEAERDGFIDLALRFDRQAVLDAIGPASAGDVRALDLSALLIDGTVIEGADVVTISTD